VVVEGEGGVVVGADLVDPQGDGLAGGVLEGRGRGEARLRKRWERAMAADARSFSLCSLSPCASFRPPVPARLGRPGRPAPAWAGASPPLLLLKEGVRAPRQRKKEWSGREKLFRARASLPGSPRGPHPFHPSWPSSTPPSRPWPPCPPGQLKGLLLPDPASRRRPGAPPRHWRLPNPPSGRVGQHQHAPPSRPARRATPRPPRPPST
jgi:hypothetical protein